MVRLPAYGPAADRGAGRQDRGAHYQLLRGPIGERERANVHQRRRRTNQAAVELIRENDANPGKRRTGCIGEESAACRRLQDRCRRGG